MCKQRPRSSISSVAASTPESQLLCEYCVLIDFRAQTKGCTIPDNLGRFFVLEESEDGCYQKNAGIHFERAPTG